MIVNYLIMALFVLIIAAVVMLFGFAISSIPKSFNYTFRVELKDYFTGCIEKHIICVKAYSEVGAFKKVKKQIEKDYFGYRIVNMNIVNGG